MDSVGSIIIYFILALALVVFSVMAVTTRKILRSATYLLFTLFAAAGNAEAPKAEAPKADAQAAPELDAKAKAALAAAAGDPEKEAKIRAALEKAAALRAAREAAKKE